MDSPTIQLILDFVPIKIFNKQHLELKLLEKTLNLKEFFEHLN